MIERENIEIAIVEDDEETRDFLKFIFNKTDDLICEKVYKNAEEAIYFLPKSNVDIVVVDIGLPNQDGIACVQQVKALRPDIEFMMYTTFDRGDKIFNSLKAGASGYLLKSPKRDKILAAVRELATGGSPMSPEIARKVTDYFFKGEEMEIKKMDLLTERQTEILSWLSKGYTNKEIASKLNLKEGTIKIHNYKIYQKLHVGSRLEAARLWERLKNGKLK